MEDRRIADEQFRRELAERLRAVEKMIEVFDHSLGEIRKDISNMNMTYLELRYTLFGGPDKDDIGLLEQIRKILWKAGILFSICVSLIAFLGRLVSPLYDKAVTDWVYNSPSEKWKANLKRPKIIKKRFIIRNEPEKEDSEQ